MDNSCKKCGDPKNLTFEGIDSNICWGCTTNEEKDQAVIKNLIKRNTSVNKLNQQMKEITIKETEIYDLINNKINTPNFINLIKNHDNTDFKYKITQSKLNDIILFLITQVINGNQKESHYPHAEFSFYDLGSIYKFVYRSPLNHTEIVKINKIQKTAEHIVNRTRSGDDVLKETPILKRYDKSTTQNRNDDDIYNTKKTKEEFFYRIKCLKTNKYLTNANDSTVYSKPGFVVGRLLKQKEKSLDSFIIEALPISEAIYTSADIFVENYQNSKRKEEEKRRTREIKNEMKKEINEKIKQFDELIVEINLKKKELEESLKKIK